MNTKSKNNVISKKISMIIIICVIGLVLIVVAGALIASMAILDSELQMVVYMAEKEALKIDKWLSTIIFYGDSVAKSVSLLDDLRGEYLAEFLDAHKNNYSSFL